MRTYISALSGARIGVAAREYLSSLGGVWNETTAGAPSPATATTLSGPTSGTVGVASTNFTVGANGAITGTVTVTPSDGGAGGTFTPTSVAISSGTPTATFTYTAASSGAKTISISDNGGLTDASSITFTAATAGTPVAFTGTVPGQAATIGVPFSLNLASYFSGTLTPFGYSLTGTLPAGLSRTGAVISGTPTTAGTSSGLVLRATDTGANTADTNSFAIVVSATADVTLPVFTGPVVLESWSNGSVSLSWTAGSDNVGLTGYEASFDGGSSYTSQGLVLDSDIAATLPGNLGTVLVRAFDAASNKSTPAVAPPLGVLGSTVPSTGTHGPGALWDWLQGAGAGNGSNLVHPHITRWPDNGVLTLYPNSSFSYAPAGDGEESFDVQPYVDGVAIGDPFTLVLQSGEVAGEPVITSQPESVAVSVGATAYFAITATGDLPLTYQWRRNSSNISGATNTFYTTPATTMTGGNANNGDVFDCVVSNSGGAVNSSGATLTVLPGTPTTSSPSRGLMILFMQ